jgi:hypothetical protein
MLQVCGGLSGHQRQRLAVGLLLVLYLTSRVVWRLRVSAMFEEDWQVVVLVESSYSPVVG